MNKLAMRTPLPALVLFVSGCFSSFIDEATATHVFPGGKVQASLVAGEVRTTTALATAKSEPMKIEGASMTVTFSLTAADTLGGTALRDLKDAGSTAQLNLRAGGRNRLEIHLDGLGCVATVGTVNLAVDSNKNLSGSFDSDGTDTAGSSPCRMTGTLADIPADR